jgi:hypothetical protein
MGKLRESDKKDEAANGGQKKKAPAADSGATAGARFGFALEVESSATALSATVPIGERLSL